MVSEFGSAEAAATMDGAGSPVLNGGFHVMGAYGIMRIKPTQAASGPSLDLLGHGSAGNPA